MPMGAANSGIYFQMVMEKLLAGLIGEKLIVYQDDILIATDNLSEHFDILARVLEIFKREGVQINTEKSSIMVQKVNFLGHIIENGTFSPSLDNIEALKLLDSPKTVRQLRSFLGKVNFYARFLQALSHKATPLTDLLSKSKKTLNWTPTHQQVFEEIRELLCEQPVLHYPNFSHKFIVSIQVSRSALVGVLEQEGDSGRLPLGYYSKKLTKSQLNYPVLEKNALAVISVLDHFRHLILGYQVEVCTSRKAVEYLRSLRDGNTRITDWVTKIAAYAPQFSFNRDSTAITHILDIAETENPEEESGEDAETPIAYTDGSCSGNGSSDASAGIGVHWQHCDLLDYSGYVPHCATNNRAELAAILKAMKMAIAARLTKIVIVSDSKYSIDNIVTNMPVWREHGWKNGKGKEVDNISDFICIDHLQSLLDVDWIHTPGHVGTTGNEKAHQLAMQGRISSGITTNGEIPKGTDPSDSPQVLALRTTGIPPAQTIKKAKILQEQASDDLVQQWLLECEFGPQDPLTKGIKLYKGVDGGLYANGIINLTPQKEKRVNAIFVPKGLRHQFIAGIHRSKWVNHTGFINTCDLVLDGGYWESFRKDIKEYIKSCDECQKNNPPRKKIAVMDFEKPTKPGIKVSVDIIGPIVKAEEGFKYILSIIDLFSRHTTLCPLRTLRSEEVLDTFEKFYVTIYGVPEILNTDRGSNFTGGVFAQACTILQITHYVVSPYHPASNGMVERLNKEIKKRLTSLCNNSGKSWAKRLHLVQFAMNNSYHSGINTSPNILTFGENKRFPNWSPAESNPAILGNTTQYIDSLRERLLEIRDIAWEHERMIRSERNNRVNRNCFIPSYDPGDLVLYRTVRRGKTKNEGFQFIYDGPFVISKRASLVSYDIGVQGDTSSSPAVKRVHVERLRPYFVPGCIAEENLSGGDNTITLLSPGFLGPPVKNSVEVETVDPLISDVEFDIGNKTESLPVGTATGDSLPIEEDISTCQQLSPENIEGVVQPTSGNKHKYNTRSRTGRQKKCYKNFHVPNCNCEW